MSLMNTYGTRTTTLVRGEGAYLWDNQGRRYLDALCGIAVCGLGHCHPTITAAIHEQAERLVHSSNLFNIEPQQALGAKLTEIAGMDLAFFSNSGTEANEAAIKIARKFGNDQGMHQAEIITARGSFHGRTMAALSATGNEKIHAGFSPLVSGFTHVEYDDIEAILQAATDNTVAVMVEPVQGEGGIRVPSDSYLPALRKLCDDKGWLLILDEIQSGNGRTGKYFAFQHYDLLPDVLTTAKGLGNGVPIGACLARGKAGDVLQPGNHGTTFGGNPLCCHAALAVVNEIATDNTLKRVGELGKDMLLEFHQRLGDHPLVKDIRGKGLMFGIELNEPCAELVEKAKEKSLVLNVTAGSTIRLLPPLIINDAQAQTIISTVVELIEAFHEQQEEAI